MSKGKVIITNKLFRKFINRLSILWKSVIIDTIPDDERVGAEIIVKDIWDGNDIANLKYPNIACTIAMVFSTRKWNSSVLVF